MPLSLSEPSWISDLMAVTPKAGKMRGRQWLWTADFLLSDELSKLFREVQCSNLPSLIVQNPA